MRDFGVSRYGIKHLVAMRDDRRAFCVVQEVGKPADQQTKRQAFGGEKIDTVGEVGHCVILTNLRAESMA